jgi:TRAP-type C4-dicarboxylate transport system substrate-binding protein
MNPKTLGRCRLALGRLALAAAGRADRAQVQPHRPAGRRPPGCGQVFAKKVEELTQGRYKVQVFCCSQLGNDPKNIEQLALGGIDFTVSATGSYAPHVPSLNLTMLPFLVDSYKQGWKLYDEASGCRSSSTRRRPRASASWPPGRRASAT